MTGGGGDSSPPNAPVNGGDFLLKLLQKSSPHQFTPPPPPQQQLQNPSTAVRASPVRFPGPTIAHDPAVAALGPQLPFPLFPTNNHDLSRPLPWTNSSPTIAPHKFFLPGLPENPNPNPNWPSPPPPQPGFSHNFPDQNIQLNQQLRELGIFSGNNNRPISDNRQEQSLIFGSFQRDAALGANLEGFLSKDKGTAFVNGKLTNLGSNFGAEFQSSHQLDRNYPAASIPFANHEQEWRGSSGGEIWGRHQHVGIQRSMASSPQLRQPPPGFATPPNTVGHWGSGNMRMNFEQSERAHYGETNHLSSTSTADSERERQFAVDHRKARGKDFADFAGPRFVDRLDFPGPTSGSNLHLVSDTESMLALQGVTYKYTETPNSWIQTKVIREGDNQGDLELEEHNGQSLDNLVLDDESDFKIDRSRNKASREKDYRSDTRGQHILGQRMRNFKRQINCRSDIGRLSAPFLAIYESLIPAEEEKAKQKQLLTLLKKLVSREWPEARLFLYGSCANEFGVSRSDVDVCLAIEDANINKSEVLLKLADILQSDNLQNVQALTRARVPIVKLLDPVTGLSCDICINNVLAVVNTKLLRDYAQIDVRLRQLAFIVKHWAKTRGVNETYQGTLSSYAYVLMCIHFLQQRRPPILPCLQGMDITYAVTVDNVHCAFFDKVEKLGDFGRYNRESIAQLVWSFFNYWAYCHDYASDVISVRTGSIISKRGKDWTRRIGNDRHLICIEDPFETSHDLGRVVDKRSIKVLREEFERAAEILQTDPNPCVTLFERYVPT